MNRFVSGFSHNWLSDIIFSVGVNKVKLYNMRWSLKNKENDKTENTQD